MSTGASGRALASSCAPAPMPTPTRIRDHLAGRVAKWWIPERIEFIDEVPKTSVGKFDKKVLRGRFASADAPVASESS